MIIQSLIDTDLYKFTMQQAVLHHFPGFEVEYAFKCRDREIDLAKYIDEINKELDYLCTLKFTEDELSFLSSLTFIKKDYIDFLRIFKFNRDFITVEKIANEIDVRIKGPWLHTILFEVPVLAIINEVYFRNYDKEPDFEKAENLLKQKIEIVKENANLIKFADFGTRRRRSGQWQKRVIEMLVKEIPENFTGTSNVLYAMNFNVKPIGTMAHEFLQACQQAGVRLVDSQKLALETWVQEYRGQLGIALSDVVGIDAFLRDFDLYFSKLYDGVRQDSGDPIEWGNKLIDHYIKMGLDPMSKVAVFSDGLNFNRALEIAQYFENKIKVVFGIGTNLTNDFGEEALQIVIKMTRCNGQPVAKVSDSPGKSMCEDESYVTYLRQVFQIDDNQN